MTSPKRIRRKKPSRKQDTRTLKQAMQDLRNAVAIAETNATMARSQARRQIVSVARDLIPQAASLARKGRPRLLAVVSRIISDDKLRSTFGDK